MNPESMSDPFKDFEQWICECGEMCDSMSGAWRWDGKNWQHYHGYPIGHVIVFQKKEREVNVSKPDRLG